MALNPRQGRGLRQSEGLPVCDRGVPQASPRRAGHLLRDRASGDACLSRGFLNQRRPRRAGELAARLETRTQEFTSPASVRPRGNAWLWEVPEVGVLGREGYLGFRLPMQLERSSSHAK